MVTDAASAGSHGIRVDHEGNVSSQHHYHGHFESMYEVIPMRLKDTDEDFTLHLIYQRSKWLSLVSIAFDQLVNW